jgi:hypothetical protein
MTAHLSSFRAALAVANTQAEARESGAVAKLDAFERKMSGIGAIARSQLSGIWAGTDRNALERIAALVHGASEVDSEAVAEVERMKGEVERLNVALVDAKKTAQADAALIEMPNETNDRLTKERDLARNTGDEAFKALVALRTHTDALEALLTVPGADGPVKLWLPFERSLEGAYWESATLALGYSLRGVPQGCLDRAAMRRVKLRQTPAPEAELKRWRVKLAVTDQHDNAGWTVITTDSMTRGLAEKIGEVIGEAE